MNSKGLMLRYHMNAKHLNWKAKYGIVTVPSGPGMGLDIDPDYILKHKGVKS